jgi:hypothetical protein
VAIVLELKPEVEARTPEELKSHLMSIAKEWHKLPSLGGRTADEIIGYDDDGLPYK